MALPGNLSTITVTGKYIDFTGAAMSGQVKFTLSQMLIDAAADTIIVPSTVTASLDGNGAFSAVVPITNDPDISPAAFQYLFEESFVGGSSYYLTLTSSLGGTVDISDLRAIDVPLSYSNPVSFDVLQQLEDRVAQEEEDNDGGAVAPYTYNYMVMRYPTYADFSSSGYATYGAFNELDFPLQFLEDEIFDRITGLRDFTADVYHLRDTTNLGIMSGNTYNHLIAKRGSYSNLASTYATYGASSVTQSWSYAQVGTLITQFGYALTGTGTITDPWLGINRTVTGSNYGTMGGAIATYATLASSYATYAGPSGVVFTVTNRHIADIIRNEANRPNRLMLIGAK